jgi:hypothetical protein
VLGRKYKILDKPKPVGIQTTAHYSATVLLYEIREIIRIDDSLFDTGCFHNTALEPTVIDPLLHLVNSDVQSFREAVWCEPISPSLGAFPNRCNMDRMETNKSQLPAVQAFDLKFKFPLGWVCGHKCGTSVIVSSRRPIQNRKQRQQLRIALSQLLLMERTSSR